MYNGYIEPEVYDRLILEQGVYYPMIFNREEGKSYYVYMPIKDMNDEICVGSADTFEAAYELAQKYLLQYYMKYGKYPKYVNPYHIDIDNGELLVMVKIYYTK